MVVLTIALGIGATTAIFSLLDAIALRELPVKDPSGLVAIHLLNKNHESESLPLSAFEIIKSRQTAFKAFAGWTSLGVTTESNGTLTPSILDGVMGGYFSLLRIQPALGRFIQTYDDGSAGGPVSAVTVISYHFWQEWYNKDQKVIGKSIVVQGIPFTIVGVAPKDYLGLQVGVPTDLTVPLPMIQKVANAVNMGVTQPQMDYALGRLNPKVGIVQARAQMASLWQRIQATSGSQNYTPRQISNIYTSRIITESASTGF
ncbi:MAG TPA: ABC transporter permease, partial [Acidobacteriaceae bacterium]|nr:ABC transporter permease [Acidobacteriaceae bacterium]